MTPTEIEQMRADMAAGTPGPWISDAVFSYTGHATRVAFPDRYGVPSESIADCYQNWKDAENTDQRISWKQAEANARRVARVPDLEAAYLALVEENARLREAIERAEQQLDYGQGDAASTILRSALGETK